MRQGAVYCTDDQQFGFSEATFAGHWTHVLRRSQGQSMNGRHRTTLWRPTGVLWLGSRFSSLKPQIFRLFCCCCCRCKREWAPFQFSLLFEDYRWCEKWYGSNILSYRALPVPSDQPLWVDFDGLRLIHHIDFKDFVRRRSALFD